MRIGNNASRPLRPTKWYPMPDRRFLAAAVDRGCEVAQHLRIELILEAHTHLVSTVP